MSVIVLSNNHLNYITNWSKQRRCWLRFQNGFAEVNHTNAQYLLDSLYKANLAAHAHRYKPSSEFPPTYTWHFKIVPADPIPLLKALSSLSYQCADWPYWKQSDQFFNLWRIQSNAISMLPGYDAAQWVIP